ncbi:Bromodomain-containing protein 1 [Galdieria sulphuraria]|nr:Bromodomain-containing protein 1 [Galdieria sulphuraria]
MAPRLNKTTQTKLKKQSSFREQPLKETIKSKGVEVIKRIQRKDSLRFFAQPVDTTYVTDYLDVIKQPMDLGTVQAKLEAYSYASFEELWQDVDLIWKNCCTYNGPNTQFYQCALKLQKFSNRVFSDLCLFLRKNDLEGEARALHGAMRRSCSLKRSLESKRVDSTGTLTDTLECVKSQREGKATSWNAHTDVIQGPYMNDSTQQEKDFYSRIERLANSYLCNTEEASANSYEPVGRQRRRDILKKEHVDVLPEPECVSDLPPSLSCPFESFSGKSSIGFEDYRESLENFTHQLHPTLKHFFRDMFSSVYDNADESTVVSSRNNMEDIIGDRLETLVPYVKDEKLTQDLIHFDISNIDFSMPYGVTLNELQQLVSLQVEFGVPLNFLSELIIGTKYFTEKFSLSPREARTENVTGINDNKEVRDRRPTTELSSHLLGNIQSQFSMSKEPSKMDESCTNDTRLTKTAHEVQVRAHKLESSGSDVFCMNCGTVKSPGWRAGPPGARRLCNACGLFWAKHKQLRPKEKWVR